MLPRVIVMNKEQFKDVLISHLYALSYLDDDEEVLDVEIEDVTSEDVTLILTMEPKL